VFPDQAPTLPLPPSSSFPCPLPQMESSCRVWAQVISPVGLGPDDEPRRVRPGRFV